MAARPQGADVDYEAKYEALLRTVLKEIESTIDGAQQNAEAAIKSKATGPGYGYSYKLFCKGACPHRGLMIADRCNSSFCTEV